MERVQYLLKGVFNIVLPIADIGTDIKFTLDMYHNYDNFSLVHRMKDCYNSKEEDIGCVFKLSGKDYLFSKWLYFNDF